MENPRSGNSPSSSRNVSKAVAHNSPLQDVIISRLELISENGKERVLEYIQDLIDMEERQLEFNRRQGRLYRWPSGDAGV